MLKDSRGNGKQLSGIFTPAACGDRCSTLEVRQVIVFLNIIFTGTTIALYLVRRRPGHNHWPGAYLPKLKGDVRNTKPGDS